MGYGTEKDSILQRVTVATDRDFDYFIQLHLTERCNLRCRHCYQTGKKTDEMSLAELKWLIAEISDTLREWKEAYDVDFSPSFNVTGGEPLLHENLFDILAEINGRDFRTYLLTNGILINKKKAMALKHLGVGGVQVSIEGPERIHDTIRGKGSFRGSMNGIGNLLDAGLKVTLNVTLSSVNDGYFMDVIALSSDLGVHRLGFSRLVPSGRGAEMLQHMLDRHTIKELYQKIFSLDTGKLEIVTGDPVATQSLSAGNEEDKGKIPLGGCAAGVSGITIMPDGTLVPCRRMYIPLGNVRKDSFREVWATSEILEAIRERSRYKGKCGDCKKWAECRGCRAIAYAYSVAKGENDYLAEDPQCFIE
jgi:radical SAM protein with 4Fe4S-binding SPASM domain